MGVGEFRTDNFKLKCPERWTKKKKNKSQGLKTRGKTIWGGAAREKTFSALGPNVGQNPRTISKMSQGGKKKPPPWQKETTSIYKTAKGTGFPEINFND